MKKRYVLDANVLMHDPASLFSFEDNDVYIPLEVIGELDKFKKGNTDINVNAREVIRTIERMTRDGLPPGGIQLEEGGGLGKLHFLLPEEHDDIGLEDRVDDTYVDTIVLKRVKKLSEQDPETQTVLVTKDGGLTIRTRALDLPNLKAEDYLHDKVTFNLRDFFENRELEYFVDPTTIDALHRQDRRVMVPGELSGKLEENQYLVLRNGESQSCLVQHRKGQLYLLKKQRVGNIQPRNHSQHFLLDACFNPDLTIVSALGKAGTGKTLLTLAAALNQVMGENKKYEKVIVFRPITQVGKELGFLPGDLDDKIQPYFRAIDTAMEVICRDSDSISALKERFRPEQSNAYVQRVQEMAKYLEKRPITFERGDTYHHAFIIVDEAQNLTPRELKMLGTRMGEGSKMVVTGDPFQIDNPYLDERNNGLTTITHRFRGRMPEFAYVILDKGERSREADIFADYL